MNRYLSYVVILLIVVMLSACGSHQDTTADKKSLKGASLSDKSFDKKEAVLSVAEKAPLESYVSGQLIVKFKDTVKGSEANKLHKSKGSTVLKTLGILETGRIELVQLPKDMDIKTAMQSYMADPNVEYAEPNYKRYIRSTIPNDTYFVRQWSLHNTGQMMNGTPGADIKAPLAWDYSKGSSSLVVAVIDTGVDYNHEDLYGRIWKNPSEDCNNKVDDDGNGYVDDCFGWNFVGKNNDPMDDHGHGTHVAGVIGAVTNNSLKIAGILWDVRIMPLKFLKADGDGTVADSIAAINYAVNMGARIINASYGFPEYSQAEYDSIANANKKGVLFVAAAGNESANNDFTPSYPCNYGLPNIISVAASDQNDNIASFSNFGPSKVDVAAPGVYILSHIPNNGFGLNQDFWPGTSMAAPHVVGLAGLILTQPEYVSLGLSIYQARAFIEDYADVLPALASKIRTGGRINAYRSVTAMLKPTNLTVSTTGPSSVELLKVHLKWKNNATGAQEIRIERMQEGVDKDFVEIARIPATLDTYTDTMVLGEQRYHYRVRAYRSFTQSYVPETERALYTAYTNTAVAVTPEVPTHFSGGGCSISNKQTKHEKVSFDVILLLITLTMLIRLIWKRVRVASR